MIKRIIFDLDNTLIEFPKDYYKEYDNILNKYNVSITSKDLYTIIGKYESCGKNTYYDKEKMLEFINREYNLNLGIDFINYMLDVISTLVRPLSPEIIDTLEYLSSKYELVVLTNWFTECQCKRLESVGILKYFKKVYGTDLIPMKPNKESFIEVIGDLNKEECLMVGDNLEVDIKVPYEMGMNVYHLNKFGTSKYPTINKIEELKERL